MVPDGYYYAVPLVGAAVLLGWLTSVVWALPALLLAAFFLWFFRDPERTIPETPGAVVSPGDGKVTDVSPVTENGLRRTRISIFLNVFNVHVNRSPITGVIREVRYKKGKFVFKQIAGLLARRIVFNKKLGDSVARGERVGLIKFGSRVDVLLDASASPQIKVGDHVKGGSSVLALIEPERAQLATADVAKAQQGAR
jgi:phosphatidylserine decarboxylase